METEKKSVRFVFYVNVDHYSQQGWLSRFFFPESRSTKLRRINTELARSGFFKDDEKFIVIPSQSTHLEQLWEDRG